MGQESQIYVSYEMHGKQYLAAVHFPGSDTEHMVSGAKWICQWLDENKNRMDCMQKAHDCLLGIIRTNFDRKDFCGYASDIMAETAKDVVDKYTARECFNRELFEEQLNHDGKLFVQLKDGEIKYAFSDENASCIMNPNEYLVWNGLPVGDAYKRICDDNTAFLNKFRMLTEDELEAFRNTEFANTEDYLEKAQEQKDIQRYLKRRRKSPVK